MKVAVIYNKEVIADSDVINIFGMPTMERYSPLMVERVTAALEEGGHNVRTVEGNMQIIESLQGFMPRVVRGERPGMVFNMAYGIQGQSRYTHVPAMLEMLGIPYVGSGPSGQAIALDKVMSKVVFLSQGLPTPAFRVFPGNEGETGDLPFPVIVKPKMEAVSFGLSVVDNPEDLRREVQRVQREYQQPALAEQFIPGREFAVALLGNGESLETLPIVEIDLEGDPNAIQTLTNKKSKPRRKICPADLDEESADRLRQLARRAFAALGLCDFARVDFRMDGKGKIYILEINSMASLNLTGSFVQSAQVAGMDFTALVNRILDVAAVRYFGAAAAGGVASKHAPGGRPLHSRVRGYLRSHISTIVDQTAHMVSLNTFTHNIEGVNTLGKWLSRRFEQMGFQRRLYPQVEVGNVHLFTNHEGTRHDILLLGHLDTHYDFQNFVPFREERGRLYGSGIAESKGGIAVILAALQALRFARALHRVRCAVLLTTDDSLGGRFSQKTVAGTARHSRCVAGTKYGELSGGIVTSCYGSCSYQVEFTAVKRSGAAAPPDLMAALARKVIAWQKLASPPQGIKVVIDTIEARTNPGRTSDHASVRLTAHFSLRRQLSPLEAELRKIAEKGDHGGLLVQVRSEAPRMPVKETKENRLFFERVQEAAREQELHIEAVRREVSADICHVPEKIPVLGGFGPVGGECRSPNEYILRDSLIDRASLLASVIQGAAQRGGVLRRSRK